MVTTKQVFVKRCRRNREIKISSRVGDEVDDHNALKPRNLLNSAMITNPPTPVLTGFGV